MHGAANHSLKDYNEVSNELDKFRNDLINTQINLASVAASKERTELELKNLDGTIVNESAFSEPLKVQLMNLQVDLARALTKNNEDHPAIKGIRDNIVLLNKMIRDSIEQTLEIKNMVQNPVKGQLVSKLLDLQINEISLQTRVLSLQKVIGDFELQMSPDTTDEKQQQLIRNRELVFLTINQLNSKLIEAQSAAKGSLSRFVMIDEPVAPLSPSGKSKSFILLIGIIAGILFGLGGVFIYDMLDNRLMVIEDYSRFFSIPLLGSIQHMSAVEEYTCENPDSDQTYINKSDFGEILVHLNHSIKVTGNKLFAVCSPLRAEGKSMISYRLACAFATKGKKVLLVDMDLFSPKLTRKLGHAQQKGLADFIENKAEYKEIILPTSNPNMQFTGAGTHTGVNVISYDHPAFMGFTAMIKNNFDVVILDTPAALCIPDTVSLMDHTDGIILISRLMHTTRRSLEKLIDMMGPQRNKITGTIINDIRQNGLNKYSRYYYKYGYNSSYTDVQEKGKLSGEEADEKRKYAG